MAKYVPIHGQMSGSLGANTYSHNKGGMYVRHRSIPTNPSTSRQQTARNILAVMSARWATLTDAQRAAWEEYAATHPITGPLGETILLTGHQWFVRCNAICNWAGFEARNDPPDTNAPEAPGVTDVAAYSDTGIIKVTFTPTPFPSNLKIALWTTTPQTAGNDPNERQARLNTVSASAQTSPWSATSRFTLQKDLYINCYLATISNQGLVSQKIKRRVQITLTPPE